MHSGRNCVFLDSGIGGLPYCAFFAARNPQLDVLYVADRENFPYGKKTKAALIELLSSLCAKIIAAARPDCIVIACNTASVSALAELRLNFPGISFVGTVPAVKPAILASRTGHIGVLGTERTIDDPYIEKLARETDTQCRITKIAAPDLVEFVEHKLAGAGEAEKTQMAGKYVERFRESGADAIVLGCTHFLFLLDEFKQCARPDISIYDSIEGVCHRAENLLALRGENRNTEQKDLTEQSASAAGHALHRLLLVTGTAPLEASWQAAAAAFKLSPGLFRDFIP